MRVDLYAGIHWALRLFMTRTLAQVVSTDAADGAELAMSMPQVEGLLAICESQLKHENRFVHPGQSLKVYFHSVVSG